MKITDKETLLPIKRKKMGLGLNQMIPNVILPSVQKEKIEECLVVTTSRAQVFVIAQRKIND